MTGFTQGESSDYSNALVDWAGAGVPAPAANATFDQLTAAQKVVAANSDQLDYNGIATLTWAEGFSGANGYAQIPDRKMGGGCASTTPRFQTTPGAASPTIHVWCRIRPGRTTTISISPYRPMPGETIYDFSEMASEDWGKVAQPAAGTAFAGLTDAQKAKVADFYRPAQGAAYASLSADQKSVVDVHAVNFAEPATGAN